MRKVITKRKLKTLKSLCVEYVKGKKEKPSLHICKDKSIGTGHIQLYDIDLFNKLDLLKLPIRFHDISLMPTDTYYYRQVTGIISISENVYKLENIYRDTFVQKRFLDFFYEYYDNVTVETNTMSKFSNIIVKSDKSIVGLIAPCNQLVI